MVANWIRQQTLIIILASLLSMVSSPVQARPGGGGHGGGAGHTVAAPGCFRGGPGWGGYGRGFYGYGYGYPGFYGYGLGLGLGLGVGYGLGYGYGYGYGYDPGYPYYYPGYYGYPPPSAYPVVVNPSGTATQVVANPSASSGPGLPPGPYATSGAGLQQGSVQTAAGATHPLATGPVQLTDSNVLLNVRVPASATVRINGANTTQVGPRREFVSSGLVPGRIYTFVVNVHWEESAGRPVDLERRLQVQGGERRSIDFTQPPPQPDMTK